ncbi:MAG TPA: TonB-dependent receptor plug domain-containing protein [Candidatus Didemnitutus sp.]|nr:TonB-dependent receptor plug domain-containing protein [Candidatus Didemnitutus sp.]
MHHSFATKTAAVLILTLGPAHTATADDAAAPTEVVRLDNFVVTDAKSLQTTLPVRPVAGVFGFDASVQDTPRSVVQINPQQFENDLITSVSDLGRYSPAVNQATGQLDNYGTPNFRGSQGDAYQNGIRLITRPGNNRPFTTNAYEGADIVAGPAPVIFGPSARTAGYVNYLTKKPYFDRERGVVSWTFGKWFDDGAGYVPQNTVQLDVGGPIAAGKLAYRLSCEFSDRDAYTQGIGNRYHDVYATLGWLPDEHSAVDLNIEAGTFNWKTNNFQNRVTNELIRNGTYLAGPATPIIQIGSAFFSPTLDASGAVTGWNQRARVTNANGTTAFTLGAPVASNPTSNTTAGAGTIVGYVLDPSLVKAVNLPDYVGLNAPGYQSKTKALNAQLRAKRRFSDVLAIVNNATYQYYETNNPSNGGFHNWIRAEFFEDRLEAQLRFRYKLFGHDVDHESNTGISYRAEPNKNYKDGQRAGYGPTGDQYDLTAAPSSFTRNAYFGATVYPFSGTVNDPVLTRFGYLKGFWQYLPVPESPGDYNSPGGSQTGTAAGNLAGQTYDTQLDTWSAFTQHRLDFGRFVVDAGARVSWLDASISNPLAAIGVAGNDAISDQITETDVSYSISLSYRLASWATAYVTYDKVEAVNGNTSGAVAWRTYGFGASQVVNQFSPADFKSPSELKEAGLKAELLPGQLFATAAYYEQTRDLQLSLPAGYTDPVQAKGLFRGFEVGVRYQPVRSFYLGLSYTYLDALNLASTFSVGAPIVADNATNILSSTTATVQDYRLTNLPRNNATLYGSWEIAGGFGVRADVIARDSANVANDGSITIPGYVAVNVGAFYTRSSWRLSLDVQNLTSVERRAGGNTPLEPLSVQGRISYKF